MNGERCAFKVAEPKSIRATHPCDHVETDHKIDSAGRSYCVPCWGSDDDTLAYHHFTVAEVPA